MNLFKKVLLKNKKLFAFYIVLGVLTTFLSIYCVDYFQVIIDSFVDGTLEKKTIFIYGALLLINVLLGYLDNYPDKMLFNGLYYDFKLLALTKLKTIDYNEYSHLGTGRLIDVVDEGATSSRNVIYDFYLKCLRSLIPTLLISLIFIYKIDKKVLVYVLIGFIFVLIVTKILLKLLYSVKEKVIVNKELFNKKLVRGFMELVLFRTNKKYDYEINESENSKRTIVKSLTKIKLIHEIFFSFFELLVSLLKIILLIYALMEKSLSIGKVVTIIALLEKVYQPIAIFNVELIDYKLNLISVKRFLNFLELKDVKNMYEGSKIKFKGALELKNVSFSYKEKEILKNVNLTVKKNERIALVGETGSGKSTLIKLMMGLLSKTSGEVLIDGKDLEKISLDSYYDYVTYLAQDSLIFDGTLRENLVFDKKISDEKIMRVLKLVCLERFYESLPNGLETELGEKGVLISGGEKQRIALARIFFEESKMVILDEATSALDYKTEACVVKNIMSELKDKTFVIIAHRLESIKDVDHVYELKDGQVNLVK